MSEQIDLQLATLSTAPVAKVAVSRGFTVLCKDKDEAVAVTNSLAPEHLEVQTADSKASPSNSNTDTDRGLKRSADSMVSCNTTTTLQIVNYPRDRSLNRL